MSSSESVSEVESNSRTSVALSKCLNMKPDYVTKNKSKVKISELKKRLESNSLPTKKRSSTRIDDRKKIEDCYKELQNDFCNIYKKFEMFHECIYSILDTVEDLENRMSKLEGIVVNDRGATPTYSQALKSDESERLDKLEFLSSEVERKKRMLEVIITHPTLDKNCENLVDHVKHFLSTEMKMDRRNIDANLQAKKSPKQNTVIVIFSQRRFKLFLYSAKKKMREVSDDSYVGLYINDNLTSYNFKILMELKSKRKSYVQSEDPFISIYSFEGKIFVKLKKNSPSSNGDHVKSPPQIRHLLEEINSLQSGVGPSTSSSPSISSSQ